MRRKFDAFERTPKVPRLEVLNVLSSYTDHKGRQKRRLRPVPEVLSKKDGKLLVCTAFLGSELVMTKCLARRKKSASARDVGRDLPLFIDSG
jgi:hypothetical protein